jgi:hypothetical protein
MLRESEEFIKLLINNEDWLMERILQYAKDHEFTKYTSTLQEAWRLNFIPTIIIKTTLLLLLELLRLKSIGAAEFLCPCF